MHAFSTNCISNKSETDVLVYCKFYYLCLQKIIYTSIAAKLQGIIEKNYDVSSKYLYNNKMEQSSI